jgi:hypothetical protein
MGVWMGSRLSLARECLFNFFTTSLNYWIVGVAKEWNEDGELLYETRYGEEDTIWARAMEAEENLNRTLEADAEAEGEHRAKRYRFM